MSSLFTNREEYGLINFLNLFINPAGSHRPLCKELYEKWVGGEVPNLAVNGVYR